MSIDGSVDSVADQDSDAAGHKLLLPPTEDSLSQADNSARKLPSAVHRTTVKRPSRPRPRIEQKRVNRKKHISFQSRTPSLSFTRRRSLRDSRPFGSPLILSQPLGVKKTRSAERAYFTDHPTTDERLHHQSHLELPRATRQFKSDTSSQSTSDLTRFRPLALSSRNEAIISSSFRQSGSTVSLSNSSDSMGSTDQSIRTDDGSLDGRSRAKHTSPKKKGSPKKLLLRPRPGLTTPLGSTPRNWYTPELAEGGETLQRRHTGNLSLDFAVLQTPHHGEVEMIQRLKKNTEGKSPLRRVLHNMLMTILGAGIVGLPATLKLSGIGGSLLLIVFFAYVSSLTLQLLIRAAKRANLDNYEDLCEYCFGSAGYYFVSFCMFVFDFGAVITYLIILGDASTDILTLLLSDSDWIDNNEDLTSLRRLCIIVLSVFVIFPFCLFRDISKIESLSAIAIIAILIITAVVIWEFIKLRLIGFDLLSKSEQSFYGSNFEDEWSITYGIKWNGLLQSAGVFAFAFVCHDSCFLLYNTLENPTTQRWNQLTNSAVSISLAICAAFASVAYLTFGDLVQPNVLNNYASSDPLIVFARIFYIFTMIACYPVSFYVVRHICYAVFHRGPSYVSIQECSMKEHLLFTVPLFLASLLIALVVTDLGLVMSVVGSLAAVNLAFVLPCACYLRLLPFHLLFWKEPKHLRFKAFVRIIQPVCIFCFGVVLATVAPIVTVLQSLNSKSG